ncbi:response regulator [Bdellovibrio sp. NC01]|uniref:response regulator n=1 Tax=Bdellovibrio sp. NC01 TaxID=2220073 RepID=UPI00115912B2|nr:response regulator [Bdellovibrio sp. NC01]QDK36633.1 hybrid sensor histidine kinase/response regulator [Bdellovibrio sp. NC01]
MFKFWKDLSVSKKLYAVVGFMAFLVALELVTLLFAMNTLSTLRAFVGGEGSWSKAQKNSIHSLYLYILTQEPKYYEDFSYNLRVNLGDRQARLELMKPAAERDMKKVFEGFRQGGVAEGDIPGAANLLLRFHNAPYIDHALVAWEQADVKIDQLMHFAANIHDVISSGRADNKEIKRILIDLHKLNTEITALADDFSATIGDGARWLEHILMVTLFFAVLTVESTGLMLTVSFNRNLSRSLAELNRAAKDLGEGNLSQTVPVRSNDELGQLAMTLNKMNSDLEKNIGQRMQAENANQVKTLFLANMSHEIRTPLGIILGLTEIIKDNNLSEEERLKYIHIIESTGKNLTGIINDILDITKVESGHLQFQGSDVHIDDVISEISTMMGIKADLQGNRFEVKKETPVPEVIFTDKSRLQQILINLINNAIKFTHNGTIQVCYGLKDKQIYIDVKDTGIGIPAESKKDLFQTFSQIDSSSTRRYEGTGLGLVLSKKIAQSLGGEVVLLESYVNKGSVFRVTIATDIPDVEKPAKKPAVAQNKPDLMQLQGRKVLIVDDSSDNQLLIQLYLKKKGVISEFADNGEMAVNKALNSNYDVVLMDMQMPVMDGYTATKRLREHGFTKPIIALTAHAMSEDRNRCIEAGCNDYLTKPIDSGVLYMTLLDYMS